MCAQSLLPVVAEKTSENWSRGIDLGVMRGAVVKEFAQASGFTARGNEVSSMKGSSISRSDLLNRYCNFIGPDPLIYTWRYCLVGLGL